MFYRILFLIVLSLSGTAAMFAQTGKISSKISKDRDLSPVQKKPSRKQREELEPRVADLTANARFLAAPDTGIFRLIPDADCESNTYVVDASRDCLEQIPGGSYYSFREREHTTEYLSDLRLKEDVLVSDGVLAQSIFVNLGNVPLEKITLADDALKFVNEYQPQILDSDALRQFNEMAQGVQVGKYFYRKAQAAEENSTYALRVIAYRGSLYRTFNRFRYDILAGDERFDMTLTFRVLRREKDGSLLIIWKELKRGESPKIKRTKKNNRVEKQKSKQ